MKGNFILVKKLGKAHSLMMMMVMMIVGGGMLYMYTYYTYLFN